MIGNLPSTVQADGINWPVSTFCDAYGMVLVDPFQRPSFDSQVRVIVLDLDGRLTAPCWADQICWHDVAAYRLLDSPTPAAPCFLCGSSQDPGELCGECADYAEFDA